MTKLRDARCPPRVALIERAMAARPGTIYFGELRGFLGIFVGDNRYWPGEDLSLVCWKLRQGGLTGHNTMKPA